MSLRNGGKQAFLKIDNKQNLQRISRVRGIAALMLQYCSTAPLKIQHCHALADSSTQAAPRTQTWRYTWRCPVASPLSICTHKHAQPSRSSGIQIMQINTREKTHVLSHGLARHQGLFMSTLLRQPLKLGLCNPYPHSQVKRVNS